MAMEDGTGFDTSLKNQALNAQETTRFPVLIIDDNEDDQLLTATCLGKAWPFEREMQLDYAADGIEALERVRGTRFALIVLDWKMPRMSGGDVLRAMRKNGIRSPVVVLSGLERETIPDDLEALGAAFLNKDRMEPESLREAIAMSLNLLGFKETFA
jgi:CheY-like chemotaxis protein